jgi:hypothetical protein
MRLLPKSYGREADRLYPSLPRGRAAEIIFTISWMYCVVTEQGSMFEQIDNKLQGWRFILLFKTARYGHCWQFCTRKLILKFLPKGTFPLHKQSVAQNTRMVSAVGPLQTPPNNVAAHVTCVWFNYTTGYALLFRNILERSASVGKSLQLHIH